jgi:hypothetical protein
MESDSMLSSFSLNNSSLINKSGYNTCNLQLNNNSNSNSSSISNNLVANDAITNQQHAMMKSNNIINNTSDCNKLQLTANSNNMNMFDANNGRNVNDEDVKDDNIANYKTHLMDGVASKFNLNNKHISCQQQQQLQRDAQNNPYGRMMSEMNGTSMPLNLCQVRKQIFINFNHLI